MVIGKNIVPFIPTFIEALDQAISQDGSNKKLSRTQKYWLAFCLMGILATQSVCWAKFERASLGHYSGAALSWMFRYAPIPWTLLLEHSVRLIIARYGLTEGSITIDDSDNKRSKNTQKIFHVHKLKDKASGGFVMGQGLVFMVLVTPIITIPVGIEFYPSIRPGKRPMTRSKRRVFRQRNVRPNPQRTPTFGATCSIYAKSMMSGLNG